MAVLDHREAACVALATFLDDALADAGLPQNAVEFLAAWPDAAKWPNKHVVVVSAGTGAEEPHVPVDEGGGVVGIARAEFPIQIDVVCHDKRTLDVLAPAVRAAMTPDFADAGIVLTATDHLDTQVRVLVNGSQSTNSTSGQLLGSWRRIFVGTARCQVRRATSLVSLAEVSLSRSGTVVLTERPDLLLDDLAPLLMERGEPLETETP